MSETLVWQRSREPLGDPATLIARILSGDRAAGRRFYDEYATRIYRLVYRMTADAQLAQDLTQDIFIRAFKALEDFRGESSLFTWLHQIAVRMTLNALRTVKRRVGREVPVNEPDTMEALVHDTVDIPALPDPALARRVAEEAEALPEALRLTLIMHDVEGYTHGEIAAVLGVPEGTCRARLSEARARLRRALSAFQES